MSDASDSSATAPLTLRGYRQAAARIQGLPEDRRLPALMELNRARRPIVDALTTALLREALDPAAGIDPSLLRFWLNHFSVFWAKDAVGPALPSYVDEAVRPHLRGRFRDLLLAVTTHPAMLVYLDNASNVAGRRNENHARELLELHTLGVDGGYGQTDVQEVARVLTGFGLRPLQDVDWPARLRPLVRERGEFLFDPRRHDTAPKQVLGQRIEAPGAEDLDVLVDILSGHPATARRVAARLCTFLVGDGVPSEAVARVGEVFQATGGDLGVTTDAARQVAAELRDRVAPTFKDPWRWVVSAVRLLADGRAVQEPAEVAAWIAALGQAPFGRTSPDGYPLRGADWISPGQMMQRVSLAPRMVTSLPRLLGGEAPADDLLARPAVAALEASLAADSRAAVRQARSARHRLALLIASPEFMHWRAGEMLP